MLFQRQSNAVGRMIEGSESGESGGIAAKEINILVLMKEVAEAGNIGGRRAPAVCRPISEPLVFRGDMSAIIMESHIFAEQAVVVAETMGKTAGDGVQQDEVGVQRPGIDKNDGCVIFKDLFGVGVDDADTCRISLLIVIKDRMHNGEWP